MPDELQDRHDKPSLETPECTEEPSVSRAHNCQVCGDILSVPIVWCRECHTPHHKDCWYYNQWCSTYGCGERYYISRLPNNADLDSTLTIDDTTVVDYPLVKQPSQLHMHSIVRVIDSVFIPARLVGGLCWLAGKLYGGLAGELYGGFVQDKFCDKDRTQRSLISSEKISKNVVAIYSGYISTWTIVFMLVLQWSRTSIGAMYFVAYLLAAFVFWMFKRLVIAKKIKEKNKHA